MRLGLQPMHMPMLSQNSEMVGAVIKGEHGNMKALLSPHFVKVFSHLLCSVCASIYTYGHRVAHPRFPSARCKALVAGLTLRVVDSIWE